MSLLYQSIFVFSLGAICMLVVYFMVQEKPMIKLLLMLFVAIASLSFYRASKSLYGYSTKLINDYENALIISYTVSHIEKRIYIWIIPNGMVEPISLWTQYTPALHQQLHLLQQQNGGRPYLATIHGKTNVVRGFDEHRNGFNVNSSSSDDGINIEIPVPEHLVKPERR